MTQDPPPFPDDALVIRVQVMPSREDWNRAVHLYRRGRNAALGRRIALLYLCCVVGAFLIWCWKNDQQMICFVFFASFASLMIGARAYSAMVLRESLAKRARIAGDDLWTFSSSRVRRQVGPNHSTFEWRYLESGLLSDDMLVLFPSANACQCLPLRCFADETEMATVAGWATAAGLPMRDFRKGTP